MWWIPAGHIPSIAEARERLDYRRAHGDTEVAFSFQRPAAAPDFAFRRPRAPQPWISTDGYS